MTIHFIQKYILLKRLKHSEERSSGNSNPLKNVYFGLQATSQLHFDFAIQMFFILGTKIVYDAAKSVEYAQRIHN